MPATFNLTSTIQGLNVNVRSVRLWFYSNVTVWGDSWYPQPPAPMPALPPEDATQTTAHFVVYEGFDRTNTNGNSLGRGSMDTGVQTAQDFYQATTVQALLEAAFG